MPDVTVAARRPPHYVSADTAPERFAVARPGRVAPAFLLIFAGLCAAIAPALPTLTSWYAELLSGLCGIPARRILGEGGSLSFRPFLLLLIVLLSGFAVGSPVLRIKLMLASACSYAAAVLLID